MLATEGGLRDFTWLSDNIGMSCPLEKNLDHHWSPGKLRCYECLLVLISVNLHKLSAYIRMECNFCTWFLELVLPPWWHPTHTHTLYVDLYTYSVYSCTWQGSLRPKPRSWSRTKSQHPHPFTWCRMVWNYRHLLAELQNWSDLTL